MLRCRSRIARSPSTMNKTLKSTRTVCLPITPSLSSLVGSVPQKSSVHTHSNLHTGRQCWTMRILHTHRTGHSVQLSSSYRPGDEVDGDQWWVGDEMGWVGCDTLKWSIHPSYPNNYPVSSVIRRPESPTAKRRSLPSLWLAVAASIVAVQCSVKWLAWTVAKLVMFHCSTLLTVWWSNHQLSWWFHKVYFTLHCPLTRTRSPLFTQTLHSLQGFVIGMMIPSLSLCQFG